MQILEELHFVHAALSRSSQTDFPPIRRRQLETLQVNLGYRCNQTCVHCHVNAGPTRTEQMAGENIEAVLAFLEAARIPTLDSPAAGPSSIRFFASCGGALA